jgi:hypothetical protein
MSSPSDINCEIMKIVNAEEDAVDRHSSGTKALASIRTLKHFVAY